MFSSNESKIMLIGCSITHAKFLLKNASLTLVLMVPIVFLTPPIFEQILRYRELRSYVYHNICSMIADVKNTVGTHKTQR